MSRDGNGNYTPPLNPVIGGQPIEADWANDTINDLAAALTDSLSRSGNGNMLAAFRATDGTITIPSIAFTNEPNSGLYRAGTGDYRLCVNGKDKARIRDVNGMAAFQVFDLAGTGAWETLATSAEVGAITLADVLAVGNTTGGTDIVVGDGDSIVFNAYVDDFCSIETNIVGPATNLDFQLGDDDGDAFRFKFDHFGAAGGYLDALKIKPDVNVVARDKFIVDVTGTVNADAVNVVGTATAAALAAGSLSSTSNLVLSANGGAAVLGVNNTPNVAVNAAGNQIAISTGAAGVGVGKIVVSETSVTVYEDMDVTGTVEADGFSGTGALTITDFIDDDTFATATATNVPTAESVKAYVDTAGGNETLAETLALGNTTGATDIEMTDGAEITSSQQNGISLASSTGFKVVSGTSGVFSMGQTGTNIGITNIVGIPGLPPGSLLLATGQGNPTASAMICNGTDVKFYDHIRLNSSSVNILSDGDIITKHDAGDETALQSSGGVNRVQATETFAALYFGATAATTAAKLQTSDTGVTVTGTVVADGLTLGAGEIATFNSHDGGDLQISGSATGSFSLIKQTGGGDLFIQGENGYLQNDAGNALVAWDGDHSELSWQGATGAGIKLATTETGINVTGTVDLDNLTIATAQGTAGQVLKSTGSGIEWANDSGGSETLAQTLALGNATGGNDIVMGVSDAIVGQTNNAVSIKNGSGGFIGLQSSGGFARVAVTETAANLYYGATAGVGAKKLETVDAGVDITGDLDVTGTITSNAFAYSKATVNNAADILYTAFNSFAGKRIINTASATATTYGLPTPVAADIGKSWIICNPTDSLITIDHDASGTANYIWIMDGVTLSAAASSWTIKKGAIVEIVVAAAAAGGGGLQAPNYLIFGAGLLEI